MTLEERFKTWLDSEPRKQLRDIQCVKLADEHAIGFAEWRLTTFIKNADQYTMRELLEIYKKQNNL